MRKTKACPMCGLEKPLTGFGGNVLTEDGLQGWCEGCLRKMEKEAERWESLGFSERKLESVRRYHKKHPEKARRMRGKALELRRRLKVQLAKLLCGGELKCQGWSPDEDCSWATAEALDFHHANNDGGEDRKRFSKPGGGANKVKMLRYYLSHPAEAKGRLRVLCSNHHRMKRRRDQGSTGN